MPLALEINLERTLDELAHLVNQCHESYLDIWLFEDSTTRKKMSDKLTTEKVKVTLHSAYKPLLYHFLDRDDSHTFKRLIITYPVIQEVDEKRFLLECYPITALLDSCEIQFKPAKTITPANTPIFYHVEGTNHQDETTYWSIFAPNQFVNEIIGQKSLRNCGWIIERKNIITAGHFCENFSKDSLKKSEYMQTEFESLFNLSMDFIQELAVKKLHELSHQDKLTQRPLFFEQLIIDIQLPMKDDVLNYSHEIVSFQEILHEELYFSVLELLEYIATPVLGKVDMRTLQTGQILPIVRYSKKEVSLAIYTKPYAQSLPGLSFDNRGKEASLSIDSLDAIQTQPSLLQIHQLLTDTFQSQFEVKSVLNHAVKGVYEQGSDKPVLISAAQHANETSAVIGVIKAAKQLLQKNNEAHFTLVPIENPDGYDMHQQFLTLSPWHIHHAVRYTALGDDLEYRQTQPLYEKEIRQSAFNIGYEHSQQATLLHINMHGYPSHEWTRPLTGYIPRGFALWTIPKGMFLIVRYHSGYEKIARELLDKVTLQLSTHQEIMAFNHSQITMYEDYAGKMPFEFQHGFPYIISEDNRSLFPITFITEYPDETLQGEAYQKAQDAQAFACMTIYSQWQTM